MAISINKIKATLYLIVLILIIPPVQASDISEFEATCLDIGFKKNTEALSDCILELMLRTKRANSELQASQQKAYEQEQRYKREAEVRAMELHNQELERQRIQALRQQQARQQQEQGGGAAVAATALLQILSAGIQGYNEGLQQSTPSYQPLLELEPSIRPVTPIKCHTDISGFGNYRSADTTCKQY